MKLKIRYEHEFQTIKLDAKATEEMWIILSIEADEDMLQGKKEQFTQDEWEKLNKHIEYSYYYSQKMCTCFFSMDVRSYKRLGNGHRKKASTWSNLIKNWAMPIITNTLGGVLAALILSMLGL